MTIQIDNSEGCCVLKFEPIGTRNGITWRWALFGHANEILVDRASSSGGFSKTCLIFRLVFVETFLFRRRGGLSSDLVRSGTQCLAMSAQSTQKGRRMASPVGKAGPIRATQVFSLTSLGSSGSFTQDGQVHLKTKRSSSDRLQSGSPVRGNPVFVIANKCQSVE